MQLGIACTGEPLERSGGHGSIEMPAQLITSTLIIRARLVESIESCLTLKRTKNLGSHVERNFGMRREEALKFSLSKESF